MATELLYLRDAYLTDVEARVVEVDADGRRVALDRTVFYPTGGGQPHDAGVLAADRPVEVSFLPPDQAATLQADDLVRTKVSLVGDVAEVRVVDIVGLDKQADGGTHVRSTAEVGRVRVVKTESKGKGNKRVRIAVEDA